MAVSCGMFEPVDDDAPSTPDAPHGAGRDACPRRATTGFFQDELGDWVARLNCGHTQHVRHRPPWELRPWVTSETGRAQHVGVELACVKCLMPDLPAALAEYKRTEIFDATTVPKGLLAAHSLKPGVWGEIVVVEGRILYVIEDVPLASFSLTPDFPGHVAPQQPHHIEVPEGARFFVRFLR